MRRAFGLGLVGLLVIVAVLLWRADRRVERAERNLALDSARVLSTSFEQARALKVLTLRGRIVARSSDPGFAGLLPSEQTTRVPFTVDYFIDLSATSVERYRWDAGSRTLSVELPEVTAAAPNVDERAADTRQSGMIVTRTAGTRLNRAVAVASAARADSEARRPEHLAKARESARRAVQALVAAPLRAAGVGDVRVAVRFPTDGRRSAERWDESRPLAEVLAEATKR